MRSAIRVKTLAAVLIISAATARAAIPQPDEFHFRSEWMGSLLGGTGQDVRPHLRLLYEDATEGIARGKSWRGTPFQLGVKTYANGVGCKNSSRFNNRRPSFSSANPYNPTTTRWPVICQF